MQQANYYASNCYFENNTAKSAGGAIYGLFGFDFISENDIYYNNKATNGEAISMLKYTKYAQINYGNFSSSSQSQFLYSAESSIIIDNTDFAVSSQKSIEESVLRSGSAISIDTTVRLNVTSSRFSGMASTTGAVSVSNSLSTISLLDLYPDLSGKIPLLAFVGNNFTSLSSYSKGGSAINYNCYIDG